MFILDAINRLTALIKNNKKIQPTNKIEHNKMHEI